MQQQYQQNYFYKNPLLNILFLNVRKKMQKSQQLQEFHVLDRILHNRNKHHICYYNSRAIKFSGTIRSLQGRARSQQKIAPKLIVKKRLLIDQQILQFKMIIREINKDTDTLLKERSKEDLDRLKKLRYQAQELFKDLQNQCRQKTYVLQKHQRNLSEPKYKQSTIPIKYKKQTFKKCMDFQYLEDNHIYFLRCCKDLQNRIIHCRHVFSLITKSNEQKRCVQMEQLWIQLITCLQQIKKQTTLDEFSPALMVNYLLQQQFPITKEQADALNILFEDTHIKAQRIKRKRRIKELMRLAQALDIQVDEHHYFDFKRLAQTYIQLRQKHDIRHPIGILLLIKKIETHLSENCEGGRCYSVEYYLGLKKMYHCEKHA